MSGKYPVCSAGRASWPCSKGDSERAHAALVEAIVFSISACKACSDGRNRWRHSPRSPRSAGSSPVPCNIAGAADESPHHDRGSRPRRICDEWLAAQIEPARQALGVTESTAAVTAGTAMTTDQAIAEALTSAYPDTPGDLRAIKEKYGGLSARERAVVAEIACGKANREIASALFVTEKTVEWHVGNSLRKLNFRARAELAVWAVAVGLAASPHTAQKRISLFLTRRHCRRRHPSSPGRKLVIPLVFSPLHPSYRAHIRHAGCPWPRRCRARHAIKEHHDAGNPALPPSQPSALAPRHPARCPAPAVWSERRHRRANGTARRHAARDRRARYVQQPAARLRNE